MRLIFLVLLISIFTPVSADMFAPSHSCSRPYKPYKFNEKYEIENFKSEVEVFRRCINNFVEEQNNAAENHRHAAEAGGRGEIVR